MDGAHAASMDGFTAVRQGAIWRGHAHHRPPIVHEQNGRVSVLFAARAEVATRIGPRSGDVRERDGLVPRDH